MSCPISRVPVAIHDLDFSCPTILNELGKKCVGGGPYSQQIFKLGLTIMIFSKKMDKVLFYMLYFR